MRSLSAAFPRFLALACAVGLAASCPSAMAQSREAPGKISAEVFWSRDVKRRIDRKWGILTGAGQCRLAAVGLSSRRADTAQVAVYYDRRPDTTEMQWLANLDANVNAGLWIPPVPGKHPHGFVLAEIPYSNLFAVAMGQPVTRIRSVERALYPLKDLARRCTSTESETMWTWAITVCFRSCSERRHGVFAG